MSFMGCSAWPHTCPGALPPPAPSTQPTPTPRPCYCTISPVMQDTHLQSDHMVHILITGVQEGGQAVLQGVQGCLEWEKLVSGHNIVMWMLVQVTPLPYCSIAPFSALVSLSLLLQLLVVGRDLVPLGQLLHHVEHPLPHPPGEVNQVIL